MLTNLAVYHDYQRSSISDVICHKLFLFWVVKTHFYERAVWLTSIAKKPVRDEKEHAIFYVDERAFEANENRMRQMS